MRLAVLKSNVPIDTVLVETPDVSERYEIYVGRAEDCHVLIDDPLISRHHFVISNDHNGWYCRKLSKLGTVTVNGKEAQNEPLSDGDEIKCGIYSVLVSELGVMGAPQTNNYKIAHTVSDHAVATAPITPHGKPVAQEWKAERAATPIPATEEYRNTNSLGLEALNTEVSEGPLLNDDSAFAASSGEASTDQAFSEDFSQGEESLPAENPEYADDGNAVVPQDEFGMAALEQDERTRVDQSFVNYELVLFGEHAPYDRYVIVENETFIGRDAKKCQIILTDPEVSSVHSVLKKNGSMVLLEDLNSSNGTILNGERINRSAVMPGDEFVIGSTSFTLKVKSDLLNAERDRLMPVEQNQTIEKEEIEEEIVDTEEEASFDANAPVEKSIIKRIWKNPDQRKKLIYAAVAICLLWVLFDDETPEVENKPKPKAPVAQVKPNGKPALNLSEELKQKRNTEYEVGVSAFEASDFKTALPSFETVFSIDPDYKKISSYLAETKNAIKRLEEFEKQKREEEERIKLKKEIEELMVKAREAVKDKNATVAESYFSKITEKDPENMEVQQLRLELEAWQKEQERIALEKAAKEAARKRMVDALSPGKTLYLKKDWYKAIVKLEDFLRKSGMDEDLVKEASDMMADAKNELASELGPVIGKARSLKEGQDLKAAYESFQEVLKLEPTNAEALNEVDEIKGLLDSRSKKIYREAIIAESLSLFGDAKEKFQEVQQISPTDSDYYKKASEKLRNYLE
ncbi:MAG: FHA domain-containing protein [Bacteriovoracaceae bacterium]